MTFSRDAKIIDLWLERQASPLTRSCYQRDVARLLAHTAQPLARIALGDLLSFAQSLVEEGLAPVSRARTLAAVKSLFGFCQRMRYLPANPAAELLLPSYENRLAERIVGEDDVARILAADATPRDSLLLRLLYGAGLRVSEACNLRWRNLRAHGDAGQIAVFGKGGKTRSIALPAKIWADLYRFRGGAGPEVPVFASRSGKALDRGRVRIIVRDAAKRAGVDAPISPHWLRHCHASHALDHGAPIHLVQATLGHSSVATTSNYLHARPGDSSARFLANEKLVPKSGESTLPSGGTGVMNDIAANAAQGDCKMKTTAEEQTSTTETATATGPAVEPKQPKAKKKAAAAPQKPAVAPAKGKAQKKATKVKKASKGKKAPKGATAVKPNTKTAQVVAMLQTKAGATIEEIMAKMSWQRHTVRGFMAGAMKKAGYTVESFKPEGGERTYRIAAGGK